MEKQPPSDCDSMTTVTVKDYTPGMEYPDPPPSYRGVNKQHPMVQVAKIIALTAVVIAGMLSASIIVSAWISSGNGNGNTLCQYQPPSGIETILEPQSLRSAILIGASDLDSSESKIDVGTNKQQKEAKPKPTEAGSASAKDSDSNSNSVEDEDDDDDDSVTMLKLPLELNLQEHMFEKLNHRSNMNCVIEKKRAEEIVDEHAKPLPFFLGMNASTDPRYLRFTGEKMIVSCGSEDPHPQPGARILLPQHEGPPPPMPMGPGFPGPYPHPPVHPLLMDILNGGAPAPMLFPPPPHQATFEPQSPFQATLLRPALPFATRQQPAPSASSGPSGAASNNIHMIGPIPLTPGQNPLEVLLQHVVAESQNDPMLSASQSSLNQLVNNNNDDESSTPPLVPIFMPQPDSSEEAGGSIFFPAGAQEIPASPFRGRSIQFQLPGSFVTNLERQEGGSIEEQIPARQIISEILQRERALPNPVPIEPRHHIQHVIRPRRSVDDVESESSEAKEAAAAAAKKQHHRVKRCACDCACKNHNPLRE